MQSDLLASLRSLSDDALVARVKELVAGERGSMVLVVAHLAELDTRDVHFRAGHGSLFAYCRDILGLSEQEAYSRITVARAARRYPAVLQMLEDGALNLTTARLLVPHLTSDNHAAVLEKARGKTKAQVEELAAALWPRPDAPSFVRKLPAPRPSPAPFSPWPGPTPPAGTSGTPAGSLAPPAVAALGSSLPSCVPTDVGAPDSPPSSPCPPWSAPASPQAPGGFAATPCSESPVGFEDPAAPGFASGSLPREAPPFATRAEVTPLSPDRYKVQVTIGTETLEKLRLAKDLLRHAVPSGDEAVILDRALTALLSDLAQKKFAAVDNPRAGSAARSGSRTIPAEIKRRVWVRDLGRCAFVAATGRRCSERGFLEFHHVQPYALGGEPTLANIQLRCRSHNAYEARLWFGPGDGNGHGNGSGCVREPVAPYGAPATEDGRARSAAGLGRLGPGRRTRSGTSRCAAERRGAAP